MTLLTRERALVAANDNARELELEKLRIALDLRRRFPDMATADLDAILQTVEGQAQLNDEIRRTAAALDEARQFGMDFVETVLSPQTWEDWGEGGKRILSMLKTEFLKLALLNPIRNLLNGNSDAPTLGSIFSNIAKVIGGVSGGPSTPMARSGEIRNMLGLASGTEYWSGGAALVGEHGPEIASLPTGTRVTSAAATRRMMNESASKVQVEVVPNELFDVRVRTIAAPMAQEAAAIGAARGAAGGAEMATNNASMRSARRLGRRW
ncbi:hypothetical protein [Sphingomonas yantingensis]|uniref:Uncharacterized protein n=1 Tax=Sphingomonas yantingensis TaxID=1241761 RepID=A0A7W9EHW0_9SPHN|nr:hypothetical protein [Sphingomonas yantingensis]MBB5697006.1 hypothetical protein [Sphingomonas yantingensis]